MVAPAPGQKIQESHAPANVRPLTTLQERALNAGNSFKEGADCPEMVVVPAGRFLMGSPERSRLRQAFLVGSRACQGDDDEHPQHQATIAKPFAVAKFALTFDEWDACATRGGCREDVSDTGWGRGRRPVINVSWDDTQAYVKWLSGITGKLYRLLSEAEYQYAARARTQTAYPWADDIKLNGKAMANCEGCGSPWVATDRAGRFIPRERLWPLRHGRQRVGVDGGLLELELPGRAARRFAMDERQLQCPGRSWRFLAQVSAPPPLGVPLQLLNRSSDQQPRFPGRPDA